MCKGLHLIGAVSVLPEQPGAMSSRGIAVDGGEEGQEEDAGGGEDIEGHVVVHLQEERHEREKDGPDEQVPHALPLGVGARQHRARSPDA